jgi:hypothetical protein
MLDRSQANVLPDIAERALGFNEAGERQNCITRKSHEASLIVGLIMSNGFASCSFANLLMHISSHVTVATTGCGTGLNSS